MSRSPPAKFIVILFAGLLVFLLYLYLTVGINEILSIFGRLDLRRYSLYYATALAAVFLSMLFYSMSWNRLMEAVGIRIGLRKAYLYCWLGNFVDSIIPFETISGEATKIYFVQRETNEQPGRIVASVVAHRIISTSIALSSLVVSLTLLIIMYKISLGIIYPILILILCSAALIMLLLFASLRRNVAEKIIDPVLNFVSSISRGRINLLETRNLVYTNLQYFYNDFRYLGGDRWALVYAIFYGLIAWLLHLSVFLLTFCAINFSEIISKIYETVIVYSINAALQVSPASLAPGIIEIVMTNLYIMLGFDMAISGTATLLIRIATFWLPVIFGGAIAQWMGVKNLLAQISKNTSTC
ncbi:MAG: lysylphosphatidylglycerol synthase transmembrane domain-containing protein [Candidatus Bathyarchaeia archaeon]